ncbi:MAG: hypothetical protein ACKVOW_03345 [Chitinophagaceae bacterium]
MAKATVLFMLLSASTLICMAQKGGYSKGDKLLNVGIGVNSYYDRGFPIGASFEAGVSDEISVGVNVDFVSSKYDYVYTSSYKFTAIYLGLGGSYHVNELMYIANEKIDLYAGATLGFRSFK